MRPLAEFPLEARRRIRGVFTDIDDTVSSDGRLTAAAYRALEDLHAAGLLVVPVTGRPAGWCDHIARFWPVSAVVGENGAFYFRHDHAARKLVKRFRDADAVRAANRERLRALAAEILVAVPGTALASDQLYREADVAIDFCEDVPPLPRSEVDRIVALFAKAGATAKISSIHVNGWFGSYDKLGMTRTLMREVYGVDLDAARNEYVFSGDSPNDSPMFAYFPNAVGVANVHDFAEYMSAFPNYVAQGRAGAGFVEMAEALLAAR